MHELQSYSGNSRMQEFYVHNPHSRSPVVYISVWSKYTIAFGEKVVYPIASKICQPDLSI